MKLLNIMENDSQTMEFWHGGNLDVRTGKWEYGPGLYLTTHYGTAKKYAKGSRKFYRITVQKGNPSNTTTIDFFEAEKFVKQYCVVAKRKEILQGLSKYVTDGRVKADYLITIIINYDGLRPSNVNHLKTFLVDNGVDYTMVSSPFGWGEQMMVLYNMDKIVKKEVIKPTDKIEKFDLH